MYTAEPLVFLTRDVYDLMVEAHRQAAEVVAYYKTEGKKWDAAGRPTKLNELGQREVVGYDVISPMRLKDIESYLKSQMDAIKFLGWSYSDNIKLTYDEFIKYTKPEYKFLTKE